MNFNTFSAFVEESMKTHYATKMPPENTEVPELKIMSNISGHPVSIYRVTGCMLFIIIYLFIPFMHLFHLFFLN